MKKSKAAQAGKASIERAPETEEEPTSKPADKHSKHANKGGKKVGDQADGKSPNHEVAFKKAMNEVRKVATNINNLEKKNSGGPPADEGPKHLSEQKPLTHKKELERFKGPKPTKAASVVKADEDQLAEVGSFEESSEAGADEEKKKKKEHKKAMKKIDKDATPEPDADAEKPAEDKPADEEPAAEKPADAPEEEAADKKAEEEGEEEDPLEPKKETVEALGKKNLQKALCKMKNADPQDYAYAKKNQNSSGFKHHKAIQLNSAVK